MKRFNVFWGRATVSFFLASLIASAFWVGNVYATTGCFNDTNGHWAETYICWMKDNGITTGTGGGNYSPNNYVTRAEMAVFMQRVANVPPETGLILITPGAGEWVKFSSVDNISFNNYSSYSTVTKATTGSSFISIHPSIPSVLYGKSLQLVGVEFCYTASANANLSYVEINTTNAASNAGGRILQFSDGTDRTDAACRYYLLPAPVTLTAENGVNFFVSVNWATAGTDFNLGRTTFVLQPTAITAVAPSALSQNVVTLSEGSVEADSPSTSAP